MKITSLALSNIKRRGGRTAALIIITMLLAVSALGGSLMVSGLKSGLDSLEKKLGADIMVVPYEATTKSSFSNLILSGNPGSFYMSKSVLESLEEIDGIESISAQYYLATVGTSCCDARVQIIGYDPETDFTIKPWIKDNYKGDVGYLDIVVGNDLNLFPGDDIKFYGTVCHVVAKLDKTGTYLDQAVYATYDTINTLITAARDGKFIDFGDVSPDYYVSCVMINVSEDANVEEVVNDINIHVRKAEAVQTQSMIADVASGLNNISDIVSFLMITIWVLALIILIMTYTMIGNERKKEFAILRAMGASVKELSNIIFKETLTVSLIGSVCGSVLASLFMLLFSNTIQQSLGVPFLLPEAVPFIILFFVSTLASVLVCVLSSIICVRKVSRVDTAFILRGEN